MESVHYVTEDRCLGDEKPGWYFWDETWADRHGPYATAKEANSALIKYCKEILGDE